MVEKSKQLSELEQKLNESEEKLKKSEGLLNTRKDKISKLEKEVCREPDFLLPVVHLFKCSVGRALNL